MSILGSIFRLYANARFFTAFEIWRLVFEKVRPFGESVDNERLRRKKNEIDFLVQNGLRLLSYNEESFSVLTESNITLFGRSGGSDSLVCKQIFVDKDYQLILGTFKDVYGRNPFTIVDAGCNIGCATLYFLDANPNASILAIEPSVESIKLAERNVKLNGFLDNVVFKNAALWPNKANLSVSPQLFRDGLAWSTVVSETFDGDISAITPMEAIGILRLESIDLFKIDIEGAESGLFSESADLQWLSAVRMIAVEVHDEFISEDAVNMTLRKAGFQVLKSGELTVGIRRHVHE